MQPHLTLLSRRALPLLLVICHGSRVELAWVALRRWAARVALHVPAILHVLGHAWLARVPSPLLHVLSWVKVARRRLLLLLLLLLLLHLCAAWVHAICLLL